MKMLHIAATLLLVSAAARGDIARTIWVSCILVDTLRSLRTVRVNGRKVGVVTRQRLIKQTLVEWIAFVAAQPVGVAADICLFWFPFYKSIKMLITLGLIMWRLETSTMLYDHFIVPTLRRHERHIDLTILLIHSVFDLFAHFLFYWPRQAADALWSNIDFIGHPIDQSSLPLAPTSSDNVPSEGKARQDAPPLAQKGTTAKPGSGSGSRTNAANLKPIARTQKLPPKSTSSASIAERRRAFEASEVGPSAATKRSQAAMNPAPAASRRAPVVGPTTSAHLRQIPRPPNLAPSVRTASLASKRTTEGLLRALPSPPTDIPADPVVAIPSKHQSRPASSAESGSVPNVSPKKRPRSKAAEDDSSNRPKKRVTSSRRKSRDAEPPSSDKATVTRTKPTKRQAAQPNDQPQDEASSTSRPKRTRAAASSSAASVSTVKRKVPRR